MEVWHMSGAGNDFAAVDVRDRACDLSALAKSLCARFGADGLLALDTSEIADFRLHFYNRDGSRAEMCGNGSRCVCRFAYEKGIAGAEMTVETDAGLLRGRRLGENQYRVRMNLPRVIDENRLPGIWYVELGDPGVPHALAELPALAFAQADALRSRAVRLRHDPAFPRGANVSFFTMTAPDRARVLTFERGVEDYTLACGTGCSSLACALHAAGRLPGGVLTCENRGGTLRVTVMGAAPKLEALYLEGPADILEKAEV